MRGVCGDLSCCSQRQIGWCRFRRLCPNRTQSIEVRALKKVGSMAHNGKDPRQKSGRLLCQPSRRTLNVRPDLTALLRDNGEAQLLIVELKPDIFTQR